MISPTQKLRNALGERGPLVAYLAIVAIAIVLVNTVGTKIINHYVETRVQQTLNTGKVCREGSVHEVEACRALINRITHFATIKQEHDAAIRLFRSLSADDIKKLGLQGVRGPRGNRGPAGAPGPVGPRGAQGPQGPQGPRGVPGSNGAPGAPGPSRSMPAPMPAPQSGGGGNNGVSGGNPPGPKGNKNNPPCPPRNPHC
jgi:hypothetical protein